jgi:hypothetical protein
MLVHDHIPGQEVELVLHPLEDDPDAKGATIKLGNNQCLGTVKRIKAYICIECGVVFVNSEQTEDKHD